MDPYLTFKSQIWALHAEAGGLGVWDQFGVYIEPLFENQWPQVLALKLAAGSNLIKSGEILLES